VSLSINRVPMMNSIAFFLSVQHSQISHIDLITRTHHTGPSFSGPELPTGRVWVRSRPGVPLKG
jgi:hypothetical protein